MNVKRKAFKMLSGVDKAFCVETCISMKLFDQTCRLLAKKSAGITGRPALHQITPASTDGSINSKVAHCIAGKRAAAYPARSAQRVEQIGIGIELKQISLHTILRKDLRLHPYRMQVRHKLTLEDKSRCVKMRRGS